MYSATFRYLISPLSNPIFCICMPLHTTLSRRRIGWSCFTKATYAICIPSSIFCAHPVADVFYIYTAIKMVPVVFFKTSRWQYNEVDISYLDKDFNERKQENCIFCFTLNIKILNQIKGFIEFASIKVIRKFETQVLSA